MNFQKSFWISIFLLFSFLSTSLYGKLSSSEFSRAKRKFYAAIQRKMDNEAKDAIQTLASDNSSRAAKVLLAYRVITAPISTPVYYAILAGLASMDSEDAVKFMARKLKGGKWPQKVAVATVFGRMNDPLSARALIEALRDRYPPVITTAIQSIARRKLKDAIEPLIGLVKKYEKQKGLLWLEARQGLTNITGEDFLKAELWEKWWSINKATFDPHKKKGNKKTATVEKKGPRFFTEQIISKRIVFVIDISGSMQAEDPPTEKGGGGVRIKRAKDELIKVIKSLSRKVKFNIIAYSTKVKSWQKGRLVYASRRAKVSAIKWVSTLKADGLTRTDEALKEAFKSLEANAIYLLTDGVPTKADQKRMQAVLIQPKKIMEQVRQMNRFRKVRIYTMGFAEEAKKPNGKIFVEFLKALAKDNGGRFSPIH